MAADDLILAGTVVGLHGLRGDLKVRPLSGESTALAEVDTLYLVRAGGLPLPGKVISAAHHKGNLLIRLEGYADANSAQSLIGCEVHLSRAALADLDEDEYYWFELEGLEVSDRNRGLLGTLEEVFTTPAHDIYVVRGRYGEVLIPAVDAFVVAIDPEGRTMQVDLPEGLIAESAEDAL